MSSSRVYISTHKIQEVNDLKVVKMTGKSEGSMFTLVVNDSIDVPIVFKYKFLKLIYVSFTDRLENLMSKRMHLRKMSLRMPTCVMKLLEHAVAQEKETIVVTCLGPVAHPNVDGEHPLNAVTRHYHLWNLKEKYGH